ERLEAKGWVERRSDAEDARSKLLYLTPAARPLLEQMSDLADEVLEGIFAGISVADAARLHETLNRIKDNLKGMTDDLAVAEA
ncbi:MAG: MarR family transcriptional regulator, partial [Alphaproteobacteria bacterium]